MKRFLTVFAMIVCLLLSPSLAEGKAKKVRFAYVEWPCATITHYIAKAAIEERLGQKVEIIPLSVPLMFQAVVSKDADASMSVWLPSTHKAYMEKLQGKIIDLGPIVGGARLGWVVPDYVPITSIEGLRGQADKFQGKIYGIEPGAVYVESSKQAIKEYGLEGFTLIESGDAVMVAQLADAISRKEWIVVTGWSPHWKFARWNLHFLDEPKGLFGGEESIHVIARLGLEKDNPEVYNFLDKFYYKDTQQLQALMDAITTEKPQVVAKRFIQENKEQVDSWFK